MADVYTYVTATGTIVPDTADILTEVQAEWTAIFGSTLILSPNTPQGALMVSEALARSAVANNNATLANQINPNIAGGVYLDAIMELLGASRTPAIPTIVTNVELGGVPGTLIPSGSLVRETATDYEFELVIPVTLSAGGTAIGTFASVEDVSITVAPGTLTVIVSDILGWDTVTNPDAGTPGVAEMSDADTRNYRRRLLGTQGSSLAAAIVAGVSAVNGVTGMTFLENVTSAVDVIEGVTMVPHSIYMCIGGTYDETAVAEAITSKKSGGCNYSYGASATNISEPITSPYSGQVINVLYDKPDLMPIYVIVNGTIGTATSSDIAGDTKTAITDYATSNLLVGVDVSAFELASAINNALPGVFLTSVFIGFAPAPALSTTLTIEVWEQASIPAVNITVNIV